jgi:riboflavin kinase/FMN adenylyltransferase
MEIYEGVDQLPPSLPYPVVSVGNFDGIHRGHLLIFKKVVSRAREAGGTSVVVTFEPHPQRVLNPEAAPSLLTDLDSKLSLLEGEGIDVVLVVPFTRTFARTAPRAFVAEILHKRVGAKELFVGHDFAFGKDRAGTIALLQAEGQKLGVAVTVVGAVEWKGEKVSSSRIRKALETGEPERAGNLLGRPYSLSGKVVEGYREGRILGFPTANLTLASDVLIPAQGVYAVRVLWGGTSYDGVANIGTSPTFEDRPLRLEVHLFDFTGDLYDEVLEVDFVARLRQERRFSSADELASQILKDAQEARSLLAKRPATKGEGGQNAPEGPAGEETR